MDRKALIDYLPPFIQQFIEMQEIMKSANLETDEMDSNIENTWNNAYIVDADEDGISKYEQFLGLVPLSTDSLEVRRQRVLSAWNPETNFTIKTLIRKLNDLCGEGNSRICDETDLENYFIHLGINAENLSIPVIKNFLETWLPAHLQRKYEFDFEYYKKIFFALISVFKLHLLHHTEDVSTANLPTWFVDDEDNVLLDDLGNVIVTEG